MVEALSGRVLYETSYGPQLDRTHDQLLDAYYTAIVPGMDRKRRTRLSPNDVMIRMWDLPGGRPGEVIELTEVLLKTGQTPTPELAGEIADLIYRGAHPNCPPFFRGTLYWLLPNVDSTEGLRLCVAKYDGRIRFGTAPNIKILETDALARMLDAMQHSDHNLLIESDEFFPEPDLYRLWLSKQIGARWRILEIADRLKIVWPF